MAREHIPAEHRGWWMIIETSQCVNDDLDICGQALLSITGSGDPLRMFVLLAYVSCKPTNAGFRSFVDDDDHGVGAKTCHEG